MVINVGGRLRWMAVLLSLLVAQSLAAATISVQSDRNPVSMNESFRLIFEADGSVDSAPDFGPLEQAFEILRQSSGTSMQIISGEVTQKRTWTVVVMPKQSGRLVVPPISFGSDRSRPLAIEVREAEQASQEANDSALFIEVSAAPQNPYLQGQLLYTVRLYRAINIANASLSEPQPSGDAVIEKLGDDREFETTRNGRRYVVLERSYAIFPQQSGELTIEPIIFEGQVVNRARGMFDVFDQAGPVRRIRSEAVKVDVQPVPTSEQQQRWLPAKEVQLVEAWPEGVDLSKTVQAGEPLTWTLTLIAEGLTAAQLPTMVPEMPDGLKAYPDQARQHNERKPNTLIGVRQEKVALIPTRAGEYRIPAIEISWWNSVSGKREFARLPARTLQVTGVAQSGGGDVSEPAVAGDLPADTARPAAAGEAAGGDAGHWKFISVLLTGGWLLTAIAWLVTRRRVSSTGDGGRVAEAVPDFSACKRALERACSSHDAEVAKEALLMWGAVRWPAKPPGSLGELAVRVDEPLRAEIEALNRRLYSGSHLSEAADWNGDAMWKHFLHGLSRRPQLPKAEDSILAPMYP